MFVSLSSLKYMSIYALSPEQERVTEVHFNIIKLIPFDGMGFSIKMKSYNLDTTILHSDFMCIVVITL